MVFKVVNTWTDPGSPTGQQQGFPAPGTGAQAPNPAVVQPEDKTVWKPERPTKGLFSWLFPSDGTESQRGFPSPEAANQERPPGSMPNVPPIFGDVIFTETPYYDRGAEAFVPNFGYVLTNPIGAGIVALQRPQASYGEAAEYHNGSIWWRSQDIPTSVGLQPLDTGEDLSALLGPVNVQAAFPTR